MRKVQLPVVGGIRKTITLPDASTGTTITEFANQTITLAQLRAALGLTSTQKGTTVGGGGTASLTVGPGLSGGGVLVGAVSLNVGPIPWMMDEGGGGGDGEIGPPGQKGADGATGAAGPTGPAVFFLPEDPEEPLNAIPGPIGAQGLTGAAGPIGPAVFMEADAGADGDFVPGPAGVPGAAGPQGPGGPPGFAEDGLEGDAGFSPGTFAQAYRPIVVPDTPPLNPNPQDDEFDVGSSIGSLWTGLNLGSGLITNTVAQGALQAAFAYTTGNVNLRGWTQPWSGAAGSYRCSTTISSLTSGSVGAGMFVGRAGKYICAAFIWASQFWTGWLKFSSTTVLSASNYIANGASPNYQTVISPTQFATSRNYWDITYDGTNIKVSGSPDGYNQTFAAMLTETAATFLGGAPDTIGIGWFSDIAGRATGTVNLLVPWFRKVA